MIYIVEVDAAVPVEENLQEASTFKKTRSFLKKELLGCLINLEPACKSKGGVLTNCADCGKPELDVRSDVISLGGSPFVLPIKVLLQLTT